MFTYSTEGMLWRRATERPRGDGLSPASEAIIQAVGEYGASLTGALSEDDRIELQRFAIAIIQGPIKAGCLSFAADKMDASA
ncbi:MAG: hypothetical protein ACHQ01_01640 [Candidatus Limnocylindrales bacterium]